MNVLLVDDEVEFTSAIAERLQLRGFRVKWSDSPAEAIDFVEKECFDIAVLDIKMPRTDGIELRHRIKAKCPDTRYIFLSGHGSSEAYEEVKDKCKGDIYLIKPVHLETLIDRMKELMDSGKISNN